VCGLDSTGSGQGPVTDSSAYDNEPTGCIKCGDILGQLSNYQLLRKNSAPWN
jgi:hypothetical protein